MNHLTRILVDVTNSIERVGLQWKEKSLTIVAGSHTETKPGNVVEIISNNGRSWVWRVVEGMEALGTWLDCRMLGNSTCAAAVLHGAGQWAYTQSMFQALRIWELGKLRRVLWLRRRPNECWAYQMKRTVPMVARQLKKAWPITLTDFGDETCANRCVANGALSE